MVHVECSDLKCEPRALVPFDVPPTWVHSGFFLTILDSSPVPTFGAPDILLAIRVTTRRDPWYEYVPSPWSDRP